MPIAAAISGAAAISAGASIYSANKASDAAQKAAAQNQAAITATQQKNDQLFAPYVARGNSAGNAINALLGLPTTNASGAAAGSPDYTAFINDPANADVKAMYEANKGLFDSPEAAAEWWYKGSPKDRPLPVVGQGAGGADTKTAAQNAFNDYLNSTGHQFRLETGTAAIDQNKATAGLLNSGSTLKALTKYGQNLGTQDFQTYLGNLQGQQGAGLSAASGNASSNANVLGQTVQNTDSAASASGNAALSTGANINNVIGQALQAYGYARGGSSYTPSSRAPAWGGSAYWEA